MTKRDFELLARAIVSALGDCMNSEERGGVSLVAQNIALELARINPRFDHARFMRACGFGKEG